MFSLTNSTKREQEPFVLSASAPEHVGERCVCVRARRVRSLTLIGRRAQQECAWLQLSAGQVQTALSSHERVIVTGKSLHDQREPSLCQICTALENFFFWEAI